MPIPISILGATGKMGQRIIALASTDPRFNIVGQSARATAVEETLEPCSVAIDFSSMDSAKRNIETAQKLKKGLVLGTTGLDAEALAAMRLASLDIPILYSPNFSLGIALCLETVKRFSAALYGHCTIDIIETHHIHKKDRPSGTALALAKAVGNGEIVCAPPEERTKQQILIHSVRSGYVVGEHTVVF